MTALRKTKCMVALLGVVLLFAYGCVYGRGLTYTEGGALLGALYGSGIGAAIGSAEGYVGEGAGIGGLVGTLIGGAIGYALEGNARYGYGYTGDPYGDPYRNPYYRHPSYDGPYYRGYSGTPPAGNPSYRQDTPYDARYPEPIPYQEDTYRSSDTTTPYSEDYYQKQNRRLMSPGYDVP